MITIQTNQTEFVPASSEFKFNSSNCTAVYRYLKRRRAFWAL